jgi:DNA mismatch endonuclease (patch repair protein)
MSAIRPTGGRVEIALRSSLHRLGLRFRKNVNSIIGRPDIVFVTEKIAVFVDGDFWHARVLRERGLQEYSKSLRSPSASYWIDKAIRRVERDDYVSQYLTERGWLVMRYWESFVAMQLEATVGEIADQARRRRSAKKRAP